MYKIIFQKWCVLLFVLLISIGMAGSAMAGGIGHKGCRSGKKIAKCSGYSAEETINCVMNKVTGTVHDGGACYGVI